MNPPTRPRSSASLGTLLGLAVLSTAAGACKSPPEKPAPSQPAPARAQPASAAGRPATRVPALGEVEVVYLAPPPLRRLLSDKEMDALVRKRLLATGIFAARAGPDPYRGRVEILATQQAPEGTRPAGLRAAIVVKLDAADAPKLQTQVAAAKPASTETSPPKRRQAWRSFLTRALDDAARLLAIQARLERSPTVAVIARLNDRDRDVRDHAVQVLGARRAPEAVPLLLKALSDEDPAVAQHAVGALLSIGDARAVPGIIRLTRRRRGLVLYQLLYALGSLGGREAEAFLWTISQGHPDPRATQVANEALAGLRRRRAERGTR